jgi:hypothetical protein
MLFIHPVRSITRDLGKFPRTKHPAGFLTCSSTRIRAFPDLSSGLPCGKADALPAYSDEFVQDFHLLPFYLSHTYTCRQHRMFFIYVILF